VAIWKLISDSFSFRNRWIEVHAAGYQTQSGKYRYTFVSRTQKSVFVIPYFSATDSFLLVSQLRPPIGKTIWQFPAGLVEKGDSLAGAARRELGEETGYKATKLVKLGLIHPDPGIMSDPGHFFLAVNPVSALNRRIEKNEPISRIRKFTLGQLEKMIAAAKIRDGWTLSGLMLYKLWKTNAKN
jgi:ADP-ribose pyrophosphatase